MPRLKVKVAGILDLAIGSLSVVFALVLLIGGITTLDVPGGGSIFLFIALIFVIMGIATTVGGVYALQRKRWRRAVIYSLFATPLWGIGIVTAFLIASSKKEFT